MGVLPSSKLEKSRNWSNHGLKVLVLPGLEWVKKAF